jgi:hypothetical protein
MYHPLPSYLPHALKGYLHEKCGCNKGNQSVNYSWPMNRHHLIKLSDHLFKRFNLRLTLHLLKVKSDPLLKPEQNVVLRRATGRFIPVFFFLHFFAPPVASTINQEILKPAHQNWNEKGQIRLVSGWPPYLEGGVYVSIEHYNKDAFLKIARRIRKLFSRSAVHIWDLRLILFSYFTHFFVLIPL